MSQIDRIVSVNITRETQQIDIAAFDIPLILVVADVAALSPLQRVETYTSLESVADKFGDNHAATKIATKLLSGDLKPAQFKVGYVNRGATVPEEQTGVVTGSSTAEPITYSIATLDQPTNGVATVVASTGAWSYVPTLGYTGPDSFVITATDNLSATQSITVNVTAVGGETYLQALNECVDADNTWYALLSDARTESDIKSLAGAIQAQRRMYFTSSDAVSILDPSSTSDLGSALHDAGYFRTALMYSPTADTEYPEASWVGSQLIEIPGSNTWEYKRLPGVTIARLTDSNITTLEAKGVNYYITVKGAPITRKGVSADESWIDEIIFVDWLHARMQEQVFFRLINKKKIPYTRAGFTLIENEIRSVLAQGVQNGGIADDTPYTVITPEPLSIPQMTRTARAAQTFQFEARLAGAVSTVVIRGSVYA